MRCRAWIPIAALAAGCGGAAPAPPPAAVVLVVIDTTRADHLGVYHYERDTTPNLDRWCEGAAVFERAFSTSSWTLPSVGSLLTGLEPGRHQAGRRIGTGSRDLAVLDAGVPTLAEVFEAAGWATSAVANNPFLHPTYGLARGFDHYDHAPSANHHGRNAAEVVDAALARLAEVGDAPHFLLVHLMDPHLDYDPDPSVRGTFTAGIEADWKLPVRHLRSMGRPAAGLSEAEREFVIAAYDEELRYTDAELGRLLDALADDALVIVTSDHGEELFDHGDFEHGHTLYQELLHVPLAVRGPGVRAGRVDAPASLADLLPTVLEATGVAPPDELHGVSLWPLLTRGGDVEARALVAEGNLYGAARRAVVRWPHKLLVNRKTGKVELYDLAADPGETVDLASSEPALVRALEAALADSAARAGGDAQRAVLDPETEAELRELGYVE